MKFSRDRIPLESEAFTDTGVIEAYGEHAHKHMKSVYRHFAAKLFNNKLRGIDLVDVGTGTGLLAVEIAKKGDIIQKITALDLSGNIIKTAKEYAQSERLDKDIEFICASGAELPFEDKSIGVIISNASLHHWVDPVRVFREIKRVLSDSGFCMVRDNMRLPAVGAPLIEMICALKHMSTEGKQLWEAAINASYTTKEVKGIVEEAGLHNSRIKINPGFLDLCITWSPEWLKDRISPGR